jgi:transcriptional regulator with XRE-family HTH domain
MSDAQLQPTIAEKVKAIRLAAGLTQEVVAERMGCRQGYVSEIELGKRIPGLTMLGRLATALETTVSKLTEGL